MRCGFLFVSILAFADAAAAAAPAYYLGSWTITGAVVAPWADPAHPVGAGEPAQMIGKVVTFKPGSIGGVRDLTCKGPRYKLTQYPPDMLFQGAFQELHEKDARRDPAKIAAGLGFKAAQTETLETGCEFDFHFVDHTTVEFGLNDYVYTMKRR
jgi:hypothetical protein